MKNASLRSMNLYVIVGVLFWFVSALVAGWLGLFSQPGSPPTLLGLFLALPIAGCTTLYIASGRFRAYAHGIPLPLIVGAHLWRYVGLGFVIAWLFGKLPPQFGIPEGIG